MMNIAHVFTYRRRNAIKPVNAPLEIAVILFSERSLTEKQFVL